MDQCSQLGGRAQQYQQDGFVYDAGPTVITAPFLFEELFTLFDKRIGDYVDIVPVEPWYRFVFPDGSRFDYGGSVEDTLEQIARIAPADADGYLKLLEHSQEIFDVGFTQLAHQPFDQLGSMIRQVPALLRLKCYRSVWQMVCAYLSHDKLRQAFSIQPLLVGGNPFATTSIYSLIHFLERRWGVHFAMGGTGALVKGLEKLMGEVGIQYHLNTRVTGLGFHGSSKSQVAAIKTDQGDFACDKLVSNVDPKYLYGQLIPASRQSLSAQFKNRYAKLSMGLFVLYFGTDRRYDDVVHHTIWLGRRYQSLLADIFDRKILAEDFSLYLHRPTATDPSMAPDGCDSFYVLSPVPNNLSGINWQVEKRDYANKILKALEKTLLPNLSKHLVHSIIKTPDDFETDYGSVQGSGFSIAPTFTQSAWFRFHNQCEGPDNIYLSGAGTHPGAGLPGVLSSAKVVDQLIEPCHG